MSQTSACVLIDGPNELVFDYLVPDEFSVQAGCRVRVPLRKRPASGTVLRLRKFDPKTENFALRPISALIDPEPLITPVLLRLADWISDYYGTPLEVVMRSLLPESVRQENTAAKTLKALTPGHKADEKELETLAKRAKRQHAILLEVLAETEPIAISKLKNNSAPAIKALVDKGWLKKIDLEVRRDPNADENFLPTTNLTLNDEQAEVLRKITTSLHLPPDEPRKPLLLHGITGPGKTEVYLQATRAALDPGKNIRILLPEISLAPQTVQRFKSRFAESKIEIAIVHSHLSQGERFDEWQRIRNGKARVTIGARSAIFAPVKDLGLIIVDEEHEPAYKQDKLPKYQARDLAVVRAHMEKCSVVLGSATPSLESFQ